MTLLTRLRSFATALVRRRRLEREMEDEWRYHIDARTDALAAAGLSRTHAEHQARREFGDPLRWKEQGREAHGLGWFQDMGADAQYAMRQMRRAPVVTAVIVTTLALGIGANTAIFSVANALLLRTLPVADPGRLVSVSSGAAARMGFDAGLGWNHAMWQRFQPAADAFGGAFAWTATQLNLARGGERDSVNALFTTGGFFATLGVPALAGRLYTAADDVRGGGPDGPVAVISHGFWQRRFGGTRGVLGAPLDVAGVRLTIVGVTPEYFSGVEVGRAFDVALPLGIEPLVRGKRSAVDMPTVLFLSVMLRLKPQQSIEAATAALQAMQPRILGVTAEEMRRIQPPFLREPFTLVPSPRGISGFTRLRQRFEQPVLVVLIVAGLVLLVACANLANLLLARAISRAHEWSVRRALGASRWRLVRQSLIECLLPAALGAAVALPLASAGSRALVAQLQGLDTVVSLDLSLDWRVLAFTAALAGVTMVVFGTGPALWAMRAAPGTALWTHGPGGSAGGGRGGLSGLLVVAQVALSLVLVVGAALFIGTFERLANAPLGLDPERVLVSAVNTGDRHSTHAAWIELCDRIVAAAASVPGVAHAAGSMWTPVSGGGAGLIRDASGRMVDPGRVVTNFVTPGWFAAHGIAIRQGRDVDVRDTAAAPPVAVVNETFVRRILAGRNAIGESVEAMGKARRLVVGVVTDAVFSGSLRDPVPPMMFVPLAQSAGLTPPGNTTLHVSVRAASGPPLRLGGAVGEAFSEVDPRLTYSTRQVAEYVAASVIQERLVALLSGSFAALALLLAGVGLYGVTAYGVSRRRREIGIRLALGSEPSRILRQVFSRVALLVACGIVVGLAASAWLSRFVAPLLYGLEPGDPFALTTASVTLAAAGALAGWLPASRAARIDPAVVLREN